MRGGNADLFISSLSPSCSHRTANKGDVEGCEGCVGFTCTIYYVGAKINGLTDCYGMAWRMSGTHIRTGAEEASCGRCEVLPHPRSCTLFMSGRSRAVYDNPFVSSLIKPEATPILSFFILSNTF